MGNFSCFCCRLLTFFKINFFKKYFQEHFHSVKLVGSRSGTDILSVLIWVQTVGKDYQQMTVKVAASSERVKTYLILGAYEKHIKLHTYS